MQNHTAEQSKKAVSSKTASKLRDMLRNVDFINADAAKNRGSLSARARIARLLDEGTFVEVGAYVKNNADNELFSGVICGYGAIDGRLVFVFSQDFERNTGVIDDFYTKKILTIYDMALKNGAPVIGIFDGMNSNFQDSMDISSLTGYGKIMNAVSTASGVIPQIAIIVGECDGAFSAVCAMFDFVINSDSENYIFKDIVAFNEENEYAALARAAELINRLPQNNADGTVHVQTNASINRMLDTADFSYEYGIKNIINKISDNNDFLELYSDIALEMIVGFIQIGGTVVGVCANRHDIEMGLIGAVAAKKAARFVSFCDSFNIPLLTLVDSVGVEKSGKALSELAALSFAYSASSNAKVSVVLGNAVELAFTLMGSKSLGADIVYAVENANISLRSTLQDGDFISEADVARVGEIDDIVEFSELRKKICAAFEMLSSKSTLPFTKKNVNYTLRGW